MVALTRQHSRRLAAVAAVALTMAMTGLAAIHGVELAARLVAQAGHTDAAVAILDGTGFGIPGIVLFVMFLGGALVGTVTIYVAMWRSPYVPRLAVALGAAFLVLDLGAGLGVIGHIAALASGLVLAWAVLSGHVRTPRPGRGPSGTLSKMAAQPRSAAPALDRRGHGRARSHDRAHRI